MQWLSRYQQALVVDWQQGRLPHALIFSGAEGVGKQALANWLVAVLACLRPNLRSASPADIACGQCKACLLLKQQGHPDHQQLTSATKMIGVDDIRSANRLFEKTAQLGNMRTLVINHSDKMTISAANALLKTLEEPSENCYLLLLTDAAKLLLPTIISRCRVIHIQPLQSDDAITNNQHIHQLNAADLALQQTLLEIEQQLQQFLLTGQGLVKLAQHIHQQPQGLGWLEKIVVSWLKQTHQWQIASGVMSQLSAETISVCYQQIINCRKCIKQHNQANQAFMIEQLLTEIEQAVKAGAQLHGNI